MSRRAPPPRSCSYAPRPADRGPARRRPDCGPRAPGRNRRLHVHRCPHPAPEVLDLLPPEESCSIKAAYRAALSAGLPVLGIPVPEDAYWTDLGTPQGYIRAHGEIADSALRYHPGLRAAQAEQARRRATLERLGVRCTGALGLGTNLFVAQGAHLHNAVLWDNTRLVEPFLYADGVFQGHEVRMPAGPLPTRRPDPRVYSALGLDPRTCTLTPLRKQGSGRMYCRLTAGQDSWIWCAYTPARRENSSFSSLAEFCLRLGLRVPEVRLHLADTGEIVSRDLGHHDLQHVRSLKQIEPDLRQVVDQIAGSTCSAIARRASKNCRCRTVSRKACTTGSATTFASTLLGARAAAARALVPGGGRVLANCAYAPA